MFAISINTFYRSYLNVPFIKKNVFAISINLRKPMRIRYTFAKHACSKISSIHVTKNLVLILFGC